MADTSIPLTSNLCGNTLHPACNSCAANTQVALSLQQQLTMLEGRLRNAAQLGMHDVSRKVQSEVDESTNESASDEEFPGTSSDSGRSALCEEKNTESDIMGVFLTHAGCSEIEAEIPAPVCERSLQDAALNVLLDRVESRARRADANAERKHRECALLAAEVEALRGDLGAQKERAARAEAVAAEEQLSRMRLDAQLQEALGKLAASAAVEEEIKRERNKETEALQFQFEANTALFKTWEVQKFDRENLEAHVERLTNNLETAKCESAEAKVVQDGELKRAIERVDAEVRKRYQLELTVGELEASLSVFADAATAHLDPVRRPFLAAHWRQSRSRTSTFECSAAVPANEASATPGPARPFSSLRLLSSALEAHTSKSAGVSPMSSHRD